MRTAGIAFIVICLALSRRVQAEPNAPTRDERLAVLRADVVDSCRDLEKSLAKENHVATRELSHYTHDLFALGEDPAKAEAMALRAFAEQKMDSNSPTYGEVPWTTGVHTQQEDKNAIEFTCLPMGAVMTRYRDRLSPSFVDEITPHLRAALAAIRRHKVPVSYTNIYLMKISNLLLLGETVGDADAVKLGNADLDAWLGYTRRYGIGEYNSPTYAQTQINSASAAYNNTNDAAAKAKLKAVLDYLWADVCSNYYSPAQQVTGASSRDYDFVYGSGPLDRYLYGEGLRDERPTRTLANDLSGPFCDMMEAGYHPDVATLALASLPERTFTSAYGPEEGMDRTLYLTPEFAAGSTSRFYGLQDREIGIRFGSTKKLPVVSVFVDPFDMPDGSLKIEGKDGHKKPQHLRTFQATAQDRGTILALYDLAPALAGAERTSLAVDVMLPAKADEVWFEGNRLDLSQSMNLPCTSRSVVIVREGKAALAARLFLLDGVAGYTPTFALKNDTAKGAVVRLVGYAYKGQSQNLEGKALHAGVVLQTEACMDDAEFAEFLKRNQSMDVNVSSHGETFEAIFGKLDVALGRGGKIVVRRVDGTDVHITAPGRLNGRDFGDLLQPE